MRPTPSTQARLIRLATAYDADVPGEESITFTMPEDLTALGDDELSTLRDEAIEAFDALYESEEDLGADDVAVMQQLADAVDAIRAEEGRRDAERQEAREAAAELAQRVRPSEETEEADAEPVAEETSEEPAAEVDETAETAETADAPVQELEPVAASSRGPVNISVSGLRRRRRSAPAEPDAAPEPFSLTAAADMPGHANGAEITFSDVGQAWMRRAQGVSPDAYRAAFRAGRRMTQQFGLATIHKHFDDRLVVTGDDASEAIAYATDESRLPGGSLTAAAWCSPSETLYDLFSLETSEGLFSLPEILVTRGGIKWTQGPDFSSIFSGDGYFNFTAEEVADGNYDGYGEGTKPCMDVPCPEFLEERLDAAGLCITSGILQNRAYPELLERFTRGALVAHANKMSERVLDAIVADSTAVAFPADQAGALAPVLGAVELQIEDYRQRHRMARGRTVEVVLPYWTRGAIRADLSRRLGVELTNVTNGVIDEHFALRGAAVQYVYNLDDMTGNAADRTAWPTSVKALIYAAGTWVRGSSDIITLDSVFDSALFKVNNFTALFTEEGWLVAKAGHDSRVVTIPICPDGSTHGGIDIDCDGTVAEEAT